MFDDVPERLAAGEAVPRSEIIGYFGSDQDILITYACEVLRSALILEKVYEDETLKFRLTALGLSVRADLITRLEGDCP